jgi:hypothetical protein
VVAGEIWCAWQDLNLHALRHYHLKVARLPIPPHAHGLKNEPIFRAPRKVKLARTYHLPPHHRAYRTNSPGAAFSVDAICRLFHFRDMTNSRQRAALAVILALLATAAGVVRADQTDDKYLQIYRLITQADQLGERGQADSAKAKYAEAHKALLNFKQNHPTYSPKVVAYRLDYLDKQLTQLARAAAEARSAGKLALPGNVQFTLIEPGDEPRQVLRLHPKAGEQQTVVMTVKVSMGVEMPNAPLQMAKLPAMVITLAASPPSVLPDGDVQFDLVIQDADVAAEPGNTPEMLDAMRAQLSVVKGLAVTRVATCRGFTRKTELKIPPGSSDAVRTAMEEMKESFATTEVLLPEEAVGAGARWEIKRKIRTGGMTLDQTTACRLESAEGNVIVTKATIQRRAGSQKIAHPMMPQAKVDLVKFSGSGSAALTVDLERILPTQGTIEDATEMTLGVDAGGQKQMMPMKTETQVHLESR